MLAALPAAVVIGYSFALAGASPGLVADTVVTVVLVCAALGLWSEGMVTVAVVALAGQYALALRLADVALDPFVPLVAAVLVLFVEITDLALSVPPRTAVDRSFVRRRLLAAAASVTAALAVATVVLAVAALPLPPSDLARGAGVGGIALAAIGIRLLLAGRGRGRGQGDAAGGSGPDLR